jgi:hypothetical protein
MGFLSNLIPWEFDVRISDVSIFISRQIPSLSILRPWVKSKFSMRRIGLCFDIGPEPGRPNTG